MNITPHSVLLSLTLAAFAFAHESRADGPGASIQPDYFAQCYRQTVMASRGADPAKLSTRACNKALRLTGNREDKSVALHNRGIVHMAKGQLDAARADFRRSVDLARKVGMQHIALAQLAHREGDFETAIIMYDLVLSLGLENPNLQQNVELIRENRERAENGLVSQQVALQD